MYLCLVYFSLGVYYSGHRYRRVIVGSVESDEIIIDHAENIVERHNDFRNCLHSVVIATADALGFYKVKTDWITFFVLQLLIVLFLAFALLIFEDVHISFSLFIFIKILNI